jgi:hypothetical protein
MLGRLRPASIVASHNRHLQLAQIATVLLFDMRAYQKVALVYPMAHPVATHDPAYGDPETPLRRFDKMSP